MTESFSQTPPLFTRLDDLKSLESDCWTFLSSAVHDRNCGWRLPVLATSAADVPQQRIVVLREVVTAQRQIFAHTDVRSTKVAAIRANANVSWLFYDSVRQIQLRLNGTATVQVDPSLTGWLWDQEPAASLRGYLAPCPPGTIRGEPETNLPANVRDEIPARADLMAGRKNFAVISHATTMAEILVLRPGGNLRATFEYANGKVVSSDWLAP